jgi:sugar phosphate isomerase/epimerase/type 1 glutamine amidotransferase
MCKSGIVVASLVWVGWVSVAAAGENSLACGGREQPIRVAVVTGGHPFDHSEFFQMFDGQPDITWTEAVLPGGEDIFSPAKAGTYDVMVWYAFSRKADEQTQKNIKALLDAGKPILILHHAISIFPEWPEAEKIIGGRYVLKPEANHPGSTYKHDQQISVKIADKSHPITRFMDDWTMIEETYGDMPVRPDVHLLLKADHPECCPQFGWTTTYGKSNIVYLMPGHGPTAFRDANYRRLVMQSIRWLAGTLPDPSEEGFTSLFNGKDLDGWKVMGKPEGFGVKDGVIRSESGREGLWMHTVKRYSNFRLRVQWKVGMCGNSGIFVRSQEEGYPWLTGTEVQITDEYRDAMHCTGSLYGLAAVNPRPDERADMWHETEVSCDGYQMKVWCDGVPVVDVDARMVPGLAGRPLSGYIGLQDSHNREGYIEYRKVLVKELPMSKGGAGLWRLGTQAYTFHKYSLFEAIDKAHAMGLTFIELFPGQSLSPDKPDVKFDHTSPQEIRDAVKARLGETGIKAVNYGVVGIPSQEAEARKVFDFARDMGIETIVSEPENTKEMWDLLDKLTQEYNINLAIHNHPKPSLYWDPKVVAEAVKGRNPRIGACADCGHWVRSGIHPLEALRMLEGRIISSHFKDLNEAAPDAHDVPWGTGKSDVHALLAELNRQGFSGVFSIEYEYNWLNSMPEIAECIKYFRQVTKELMNAK